MAPKTSSASSGTRKKHARKAAGPQPTDVDTEPAQKKGKTKKHRSDPPRAKVYIAPVKPTAAHPDPLDSVPGLAHRLPPALLVVLRSLGKKAPVTKVRALEELLVRVRTEEDSEEWAVREMLPVWTHHVPGLLVHPTRRVRLLTAQVHAALLPLLDDAPSLVSSVWALAAHDPERAVASVAAGARSPGSPQETLCFLERVLLTPDSLYLELNPAPAPVPDANPTKRPTGVAVAPQQPRAKADEQDESAFDHRARLRIAGLGALRWLLESTPSLPFPPFLASPALWSALQHEVPADSIGFGVELPEDEYTAYLKAPLSLTSFEDEQDEEKDTLPLGRAQPALRRAAWGLLVALLSASGRAPVQSQEGVEGGEGKEARETREGLPPALVLTLAHTALPAAWAERDAGVQGAMWGGVLVFLRANPHAWKLAPPSGSFGAFLTNFLARACNSAPNTGTNELEAGYAAVVVVVGSVPWELLSPLRTLLDAFWAALFPSSSSSSSTSAGPAHAHGPAAALTTALPGPRARAGAAFLGALLECGVFGVRRGRAAGKADVRDAGAMEGDGGEGEGREGGEGDDTRLFAREIARVWAALGGVEASDVSGSSEEINEGAETVGETVDGKEEIKEENENEKGVSEVKVKAEQKQQKQQKPRLYVDTRRAAGILRGALAAAGGVGGDLLAAALDSLGACLRAGGPPPLVCAVLEALAADSGSASASVDAEAKEEENADPRARLPPAAVAARIHAFGLALRADVLRAAVAKEDAPLLVRALGVFGGKEDVWGGDVGEALDLLLARRAYALLLTAPPLLLAYLAHCTGKRQELWSALLTEVAAHPEAAADALGALVAGGEAPKAVEGLTAVDPGAESTSTSTSTTGPLDALFAGAPPVPAPLLAQVLQRGELFLSPGAWRGALARVVSAFVARVETALVAPATDPVPLSAFDADLQLLASVLAGRADAADPLALLPAVWVFAYVLPSAVPPEEREADAVGIARNIWLQWNEEGEKGVHTEVVEEVKRRLGVLVCSTDVCVTPEDVLDALAEGTLGAPLDVVADVFPSKAALDAMLDALPADPPAASLAVLHPHLPPASALRPLKDAAAHDARGYTAYARIVAGLLHALAGDRRAAKTQHVWALRHVIALAIAAEDLLAVPAAPSALFDARAPDLDLGELTALAARAQQLTTYLLTAAVEDGWCARVLEAVSADKALVGSGTGALPGLLVELVGCARRTDGSRECRVLDRVLRHVLQDADKAEADLWVTFARKIEKSAPETCIAIVSAVTASTLEPPRLERYRNELAADLLGIPPSKANTQGLLTLRKLAASAPGGESDVVFLPQQRSVNIFKACQQWIASDEDIEEELESAMTLVFFHLAPLLQNVPGTHWDLIFDVIESNLESAALTDDETLVTLARTLWLIILIQDLALTNKALRASWEERQMQILTMVRDLAAGQLDDVAASTPRSTCRELVLSIVQDLPASLITEDTLPKMCHLLADPSADVQKMTYQLLTVAARKRTEHFVIEAGVDVDAVVKADLPIELLDILQTTLNFGQGDLLDLDESIVFGYLLGWMVVLDLFVDASLKIRLSYIDQLRTLDIIAVSFIPNLLSLLGVDQGIPKAFKLDVWTVDEYYVPLYESGSPWSLQVLAAHLYYRALLTVPSLIYNWVLDCKDRQLSSSIATYTSLHFSPVIIRAELAHVKSPEVTAELVDENLTIKVATAVNEVVASYLVDEHQLEIKLKIPSDWPLHKIEVKDVQRVGVEETRWRAWILAVQQTLWSQNGRVADGIGLFKKNVTLHFEGQVECAICYSIISVMDGTLPRKPCKTCKNRFHSGCLYKWFSSSHSSSCPLCRSDII
ncbi:hypothetical protein DFH06DRAFT_1321521 [Mycena polygramma]|nr:hypothetical protein DFH06DRAFT_1321521 [Mycena polygramma]